MAISVTQPIGQAIDRTKKVLFQPFDLGRWFTLGFCAFLASLGYEGGDGGGGSNWGGEFSPVSGPKLNEFIAKFDLPEATSTWLQENSFGIVLGGIFVATVLVVLIAGLVIWLQSRGRFMFIDGIVMDRSAVVEPWKEFRAQANSLCLFKFFMYLVVVPLGFSYLAAGMWIAWGDIQAEQWGTGASLALAIFLPLMLLTILAVVVIDFLLRHFVTPVMYLHRSPVLEAWSTAWRFIICGNGGRILLFFLMRVVLLLASGIIATMATCATCCVTAIPYIGTVMLLPILVFNQSYSLYFLAQFGEDWNCFAWDRQVPDTQARD